MFSWEFFRLPPDFPTKLHKKLHCKYLGFLDQSEYVECKSSCCKKVHAVEYKSSKINEKINF